MSSFPSGSSFPPATGGAGITDTEKSSDYTFVVGDASHRYIHPDTDDNQNIVLHPPKLFIGCSTSYSRPTNIKSLVAINNILGFTQANPFLVTIDGQSGYEVNPDVFQVYEYQVTVGDTGSGNVFYLNGNKQLSVKIIVNNTYAFINRVSEDFTLKIFDTDDNIIENADIAYSTDEDDNQVILLSATSELLGAYPDGFKYGKDSDSSIGSTISWYDVSEYPEQLVEYTVGLHTDTNGNISYTLNDLRKPIIEFVTGTTYRFTNPHGDVYPLRVFSTLISGTEDSVIVNGVTVTNGGTVDEVVEIDTYAMNNSGKIPLIYGSTTLASMGNAIRIPPLDTTGNYNMNTVGGGTTPSAAGETDYIYIQMEIDKDTDVGSYLPNIVIEYDES